MSVRVFIIALTGLLLVIAGCSSKAVKREVKEVRTDPEKFSAEPLPLKPDADRINRRAYDHFVTAALMEDMGRPYEATEYYRRALRYYPDSYEIRLSLATNLYRMQRFEDALAVLHSVRPEDGDVWEMRGDIYRATGENDSALVAYRQAVSVDTTRDGLYSFLAAEYGRQGMLDSTLWALENLARLDPQNYAVWYEIGRLHLRLGNAEPAKENFSRSAALLSDERNVMALVALGEIHEVQEQLDSALYYFKQSLQADPDNISVHRNLAGLYVKMDSLEAAAQHARIESELAPLDRSSSRRLGMLYYYLDSLSAADSVFTWLVESGENNIVNHQFLARIALQQGNTDKAIEQYRVTTRMADSAWDSWFNLGLAYRAAEERDKELEAYRKSLELTPDVLSETQVLFAMGTAYEAKGDIEESVSTFERLLKLQPNHDGALNYLGYTLADRGERLEYARDLIKRAVELDPDNAAYLDSYGWVYYRLGEHKKARKYLQQAVELDTDSVMFDHLGDVYHALGNTEKARHWWQKALELDPENESIRQKLGQ